MQVDANGDGDLNDPEDLNTRTDYHVDHRNHTGYAQVLEEMQSGAVVRSYTIGHDVFLEAVAANDARRLLKDGHGSTRALVDATGTVLSNSGEPQIYAYDAYNLHFGYTTSNVAVGSSLSLTHARRDHVRVAAVFRVECDRSHFVIEISEARLPWPVLKADLPSISCSSL